ncbi:MAG: 4-hydroxyacetophenone monooxygenase, partial [Acidimicrobiales bacterium]
MDVERNPHAGMPFTDDDAVVASMLEELSAPALLCSLVHMTGDPSWIRERALPQPATSTQFQCGLDEDERAEIFRAALPAVAAYRDAGCEPHPLSPELLRELMSFLAGETVPDRLAPMLFEDLQFDGIDPRAIAWGDEVADDVKAAAPVIVIGCGQAGILAGIRLT